MAEKTCNTCKANKVCDHNKYGFENCNNYISTDVMEVKDCNLCVFNSRHATEYPCSHCKNCYTDKFKPIE